MILSCCRFFLSIEQSESVCDNFLLVRFLGLGDTKVLEASAVTSISVHNLPCACVGQSLMLIENVKSTWRRE